MAGMRDISRYEAVVIATLYIVVSVVIAIHGFAALSGAGWLAGAL